MMRRKAASTKRLYKVDKAAKKFERLKNPRIESQVGT